MNENFKVFREESNPKSTKSNLSEFYEKLMIAIKSKDEQSLYELSKIINRFYFKEFQV